MNQTLRSIVAQQIATARTDAIHRFDVGLRETNERAGGARSSRLAVIADELAATNLRERAERNLALVEAAAASARLPWAPEFGDSATAFLASELDTDYAQVSTRLTEFQQSSFESSGMLTAAQAIAQSDTDSRIALLVYSSDINRHPILSRLTAPRYADVKSGWEAAMAAAEATEPDWKEVARNATAAVEELARLLTGKPSQTLGEAITDLRSGGRIDASLAKTIDGAWGWASTHVRHGSAAPPKIDKDEAAHVYRTFASALHLLLSADT